MNAEQAKKISLPDLMAKLGHEPVKVLKGGNEIWYVSPFRTEKEASFHTSFLGGKWIWNDFGDTGGTVIDFAIRYNGFHQVRDALTWLAEVSRGNLAKLPRSRVGEASNQNEPDLFSQPQSKPPASLAVEDRQLRFIEALPLTNPLILEYLARERRIPEEIARHYLCEVRYRNAANGKDYFAFGMKNESGGYEIRVASSKYSFKSALIARDITLIQGASPERGVVNIFEGMTDFLSLLVMMNTGNLSGDSIIMHSLSSYQRAADVIRNRQYTVINTFLDNNRPGQEGTERFKADFTGRVAPQSHIFAPYADLNDALCANRLTG